MGPSLQCRTVVTRSSSGELTVHPVDRPRRLGVSFAHQTGLRLVVVTALFGLVAATMAGGVGAASPGPNESGGYAPRFSRIFVIVIENQSFDDIFTGNPGAHYILDELTPASAVATRFYAPKRNSPTAYFAMSSGHTYTEGDGGRWAGKCDPSLTCSTTDPTVYEQLVDSGRTWRIYSEDQTEPCQTEYVDKYWLGHNPALFYRQLGPNGYTNDGDGSCRENDLPLEALTSDFQNGTVPDYALIVPNNCSNMHDACYPLHDRVMQGDAWLRDALGGDLLVPGGLIPWVQANDTLLVITYDEARLETDREGCCPYTATGGGGHIPTWVVGPAGKVEPGARSDVQLSNFSILRTIEENWDLELLGRAADEATVALDSLLIPTPTRQALVAPGSAVKGAESSPDAAPAAPAGAGASAAAPSPQGAIPAPTANPDAPARSAAFALADVAREMSGLAITFVVVVVPIAAGLLFLRRRSADDEA